MKIARARMKEISTINPELICCEEIRIRLIKEHERENNIVLVDLNTIKLSAVGCKFCGITKKVKTILLSPSIEMSHGLASFAILEELDIDEGLTNEDSENGLQV